MEKTYDRADQPPRGGKPHAIQQQSERSLRKAGDNDLQAKAAESDAVEE